MAKVKSSVQTAALLRRAVDLHREGQLQAAQTAYLKYLKHVPSDGETMGLLAVTKFQQGYREGALDTMKRALALAPDVVGLRFNYAKMLVEQRHYDEAETALNRVLAADPAFDPAFATLGAVLLETGRPAEAIEALRKAISLAPGHANYASVLAAAFARLYQFENAELALRHAWTLDPTNAELRLQLARRLYGNNKFAESAEHYQAILDSDPHHALALGNLVVAKLRLADWDGLDALAARFLAVLGTADGTSRAKSPSPYVTTLISDDPADCYKAARARARSKAAQDGAAKAGSRARSSSDKIRVAYVSADYHAHATSYLVCELIELHDRSRFEIIGISYGPADQGPMRQRISAAFDRFIDVAHCTSAQMVAAMREQRLDIAVDLQGFNQHNRMEVFAARPAPVQVLYLGWPGTSGAPYYDYVLADPVVAPRENFPHFSEGVVWLPGSYQANDRRREVAAVAPTRAECGLPDGAFVYACFNNIFKILPAMFDAWMRILHEVPDSVLWLTGSAAETEANLRQQAALRGLDPKRLVFAPWLPNAEHLARLSHVDLVLDTLPYNAHTTASDALWQGVPVLTRTGRSFAGRVATSLLHARALPELIVDNLADYEARAARLANDPALLGPIRDKLKSVREEAPLFDTPALARDIERAFVEMKLRHDRGDPASLIDLR
jgi:predicted O-linked N-acetylglucosamine transferase (SPINDLY family)